MKTILLAGATGLVGSRCLEEISQLLKKGDQVNRLILVGRRSLETLPEHPEGSIEQLLVDFANMSRLQVHGKVDAVICCLGTTIRAAGSQEAFAKVDRDFVVELGRWAKANGVPKFSVVSAMGSDSKSAIFYNRIKGEMEDLLSGMGFESLGIFRPSLLLGERKELRPGEKLAIVFGRMVGPLMLSFLKKYRPIEATTVARAIVNWTLRAPAGNHVYLSDSIQEMADRRLSH